MIDSNAPAQWRGLRPRRLHARLAATAALAEAADNFGKALLGTLDGRTYETVALRVGARRDCGYVWRGHCLIAETHPTDPRSREQIARIAAGPRALAGRDAAVVTAVDALLDGRDGLPALRRLGPDGVPVILATAFYDAIATLMAGAAPEPDAVALQGVETPADAVRNLDAGSLS